MENLSTVFFPRYSNKRRLKLPPSHSPAISSIFNWNELWENWKLAEVHNILVTDTLEMSTVQPIPSRLWHSC